MEELHGGASQTRGAFCPGRKGPTLKTGLSEPHFGEVSGDARPWLMARWKAQGRLSICVN